jgi:hypothetical protein
MTVTDVSSRYRNAPVAPFVFTDPDFRRDP